MVNGNDAIEDMAKNEPPIDKPIEAPKEEPAELSVLERVELANKKAEEILKKSEEVLRKNEDAVAKLVLGGRSYAGQSGTQPTETEDEKWAREAKVRYEGTGMDPTPSTQ